MLRKDRGVNGIWRQEVLNLNFDCQLAGHCGQFTSEPWLSHLQNGQGQVPHSTVPAVPATGGGGEALRQEDHLGPQVPDQPGQHRETAISK